MGGKLVDELGIQSYCFRGFSEPGQLVSGLRECGVDRLELCGKHWDIAKNPDPAAVLRAYESAGIAISSFGVHGIGADEAAARPAFEMARLAGFPTVSADLKEGGLSVAEKLCEEFGKKIAIHNHGRRHRYGPAWALQELFSHASANVGLCLDTAWALDSGDDPLAVAKRFCDRLYGLHVKDFVFDKAGKPEDVVVGEGNLDLPGMAKFLEEVGFDGYLTLEYEGDVDNPVPALKKCCDRIREAFSA